jgi:predicted O-linked N-acetylglucosamine transferase (SPINDLY family)
MDNFELLFQDCIINPSQSTSQYTCKYNVKNNNDDISINNELYKTGYSLLFDDLFTISQKENIINKLLIIFPLNDELYYYMGCIFKDIDIYKALLWFQKCFFINKYNIENLLDLLKIIYEKKYVKYFDNLNIDITNYDDPRVLLSLSCIYMIQNHYSKSKSIMINLINTYIFYDLQQPNSLLIYNNKINIIPNYIQFLYSLLINYLENFINSNEIDQLNEIDQFILFFNKTLEFYKKYTNEIGTHQFKYLIEKIIQFDYYYHDLNERFQFCKLMNTAHINENLFDFSNIISQKVSNNKINIGYVSDGFIHHAVSNFIQPIIENHNLNHFNVFLFVQKKHSLVKIKYNYLNCIDIENINTIECANMIYENKIDILIDLNGITNNNRLDIFSKNPAPIQITYLGYPNSCGLSSIKYRIIDHITDPINSLQLYSEKLLKMPKCFLLFKSILQNEPVFINRTNDNDDSNHNRSIILGSLNKENKNSKEVLNVWKIILCKTRDYNTKILVKIKDASSDDYIKNQLNYYTKILDIDEDRIIIESHFSDNHDYINIFNKIDILLDTFPYSGTTTTCNSLYNSVPVVTLFNKDYHSHNVTSSLLFYSDLKEFIAFNEEEYINIVVNLTSRRDQLIKYKSGYIHKKFMDLMNPLEFMESYENILEKLYNDDIINKL